MINKSISCILQILLFHYYISKLMDTRVKKNHLYMFYLVEFIIVMALNTCFSIMLSSALLYILSIICVVSYFKANLINKILYVGSLFGVASISEMLSMNILCIIFVDNQITNPLSIYFLFGVVFSCFLEFILLTILLKFFKMRNVISVPILFYMILLTPILTYFLISSISDYALISKSNQIRGLTISLGLLIANLGSLFIFSITLENIDAKNNMNIALLREKLATLNYELLIKQNKSHYKILHDTRSRLNKIMTLASAENYHDLKIYTYQLYKNVTKTLTYNITEVPVFNLLLDNMLTEEKYSDLNIKIQFDYENLNFLDIYDQMILFNNILFLTMENSLLCDEKDRFIIIKSFDINEQISIVVNMSINGDIKYLDKANDIESITKKYDGFMTIDMNNQESCKIILTFFKSKVAINKINS